MSFIKTLSEERRQAIAVFGTADKWIYNYFLRQRISILGVKLWKTIGSHTFTFPRYTNNPKYDGLSYAMHSQRNRYPF